MTITIPTPTGRMAVRKADCIGCFYTLFVPSLNRRVIATCIDATPEGTPKRMRIQKSMEHGGDVLMPGQYDVLEKDTLWED